MQLTFMKRFLAPVLAILLIDFLFVPFAPAQTAARDARSAAKVRARIMSLGAGPTARVSVKLRDGATVEGYVFEAGEDHFTIVDESNGAKRYRICASQTGQGRRGQSSPAQ